MKNNKLKKTLVYLIISVFVASPLIANEIHFPYTYSRNGVKMHKTGDAELKYKKIIPAYMGAFYLQQNTSPQNALENVARKLELHYYHNIKAEDFANATVVMVKQNVSVKEYEKLEGRLQQFVRLYRNVKKNDRYSLIYTPEKGTELALNGKVLGSVQGADLSRALFSIWIGKSPIDKKFRNEILGL